MLRFQTILLFSLLFFASCRNVRIKEHTEWESRFREYGITNGCFILRDHAHESVHLYNKERCLQRYVPASTFNIMISLVALETGTAQDETLVIPWDKLDRKPEWNRDMDMREAMKVSNLGYFQELARRIGRQNFQHYLDTIKYGNMTIGRAADSFWINNSLQISADEQIGFLRKLYFEELPFTVRTQTIVRSIMLREDSAGNKFYYKTGWGYTPKGNSLLWVVGFLEHAEQVREEKASMNKSNVRNYPYFFALNFELPPGDTTRNWPQARLELLHKLLDDYGATRNR